MSGKVAGRQASSPPKGNYLLIVYSITRKKKEEIHETLTFLKNKTHVDGSTASPLDMQNRLSH